VASRAGAEALPSAAQEAAQHEPPAGATSAAPRAPPAPPELEPQTRPVDLAQVEVVGAPKRGLAEDERIGDYAQPRWSARRRFPTTRLYVMPKGEVEAEYWLRYTAPLKDLDGGREVRSYYELGFGLGHRLQLDIYLVTQQTGHGPVELKREMLEMRYALADYGKLWGNPTLYLEWQRRNGENDWIEPKLLLGGELAPRWHGAFNLVLERELGGKEEHEWDATGGVSYTAVDEVLHAGVELYAEVHDSLGHRFAWGETEQLFLAGPSFMVSPIPRFHLLVAPLFGAGKDGSAAGQRLQGMFRQWVVASWAF
jgi:hypothetical protein